MIRSMTAFSRKQSQEPWGQFAWELRSVNHRYLELAIKLPEPLRDLEMPLRDKLKQRLGRGKVEINLHYKTLTTTPDQQLIVNHTLIDQLSEAADTIAKRCPSAAPLSVSSVLKWPGVLETPSIELDTIKASVLSSFEEALNDFIAMREGEGHELHQFIQNRLDQLSIQTEQAAKRAPMIIEQQRERLKKRLDEMEGEPQQERLEQEMIYWAQKLDVAEELDRLGAHIAEIARTIKKGGVIGRRLDFLMQELNREANTFGSKSVDAEATQCAVEMKVLIEQMREQIQNIE